MGYTKRKDIQILNFEKKIFFTRGNQERKIFLSYEFLLRLIDQQACLTSPGEI